MKRFVLAFVSMLLMAGPALADMQGLLQMLDYLGADYPEAVADGKVINKVEYAEMNDFAAAIAEQTRALPDSTAKAALAKGAADLEQAVAERTDPQWIADHVGRLRETLIESYGVTVVPRRAPDISRAAALYAKNCASCHGAQGRGDGPAAHGLDPAPTDFTDADRHAQRTLYGLYNTITLGVKGTGMASFHDLPEFERWSLSFYVGQLAANPESVAKGREILARGETALADLKTITTLAPAEAEKRYGQEGRHVLTYLRSHPQTLFSAAPAPLDLAKQKLDESVEAYRAGRPRDAYDSAVTAYLEGFELMEPALAASAPELMQRIEAAMIDYRNALRGTEPPSAIAARAHAIEEMLRQADARLSDYGLSASAAYSGALVILLREGLEALLVVAALAAFLVKTGRRDALRYLHTGWGMALLAGIGTWWLSTYVIAIGGAGRELTEGIAALVAASVLFYVGFWMHAKTHALQWQHFIQGSVNKALSKGTLWGLATLSFIAVYREIFETILFYQAIWVQTDGEGQRLVMGGFVSGVVLLVLAAWGVMRYSERLPLRQFFGVTGLAMLILAVVFLGKGVSALQEAGKLSSSPVPFPTIDLLGIYPNFEGLLLQALMLATAAMLVLRARRARPA